MLALLFAVLLPFQTPEQAPEASLLVRPMYLAEEPPQLRSASHILLMHVGVQGCPPDITRTREETLSLAKELVARLRAGTDFQRTAEQYSQAIYLSPNTMLGSFGPGMLAPAMDAFLFSAAVGDVSDPIAGEVGVHILRRVESRAAVRQIMVAGSGTEQRARMVEILKELQAGADFAELARTRSEHKESAARGGALAIYQRGARDTLLKEQAFRMRIGEIAGPIETPLGFHILQRVELDAVDPSLAETNFSRLRAVLVQYIGSQEEDRADTLDQRRAKRLASDLHARIQAGEDFAKIASEHTDDPGGRERGGDVGWVYRSTPNLPLVMQQACALRVGQLLEPQLTPLGYVILQRTR